MHPLNALLSTVLIITQLLMIKEPITGFCSFFILCFLLLLTGQEALIKKTLLYSKWPIILIFIINPLIISLGDHILYEVYLKKLYVNITLESLIYSGLMALKLLSLILSIQLTALLTSREQLFTFMSTYCRQLTLTFSMSSNAVTAIYEEYSRVQMVMVTRGFSLEGKRRIDHIKNRLYLIKVVFISVLESSFHRSEALYVRHYTKTPGSTYQPLIWAYKDRLILIILLILLTLLIVSGLMGFYTYTYYPTFKGDLYSLPFLNMVTTYIVMAYGIKEQKKDV
jgi:energy-coupling factor transporter transmembrane protein EcfT